MREEVSRPRYWVVIPAIVRYDPQLKPNAKLLYGEIGALCSAKGYCWVRNQYFADLYGVSIRSIRDLISSLAQRGYVRVAVQRDEETHEVQSRKIWLTQHTPKSPPPGENLCPASGAEQVGPQAQIFPRSGTNPPDPQEEICPYNNTSMNKIPPIPPTGETAALNIRQANESKQRFEAFWRAYPRKVNRTKAAAAWRRLKPDLELCRKMAQALDRFSKSEQWTRENGAYIPHPATWLNNRRWEDEDLPPTPGDKPCHVTGDEGVPVW